MTHDTAEVIERVAWQAASAAGEIIRAGWHQPRTIAYKGPIDLVTSVDRAAERKIVELLKHEFPEHRSWRRKKPKSPAKPKKYRWIIDPLDGTTNFAHGYPQVWFPSPSNPGSNHRRIGLRSAAARMFQSRQRTRRNAQRRSDPDFRGEGIGQGAARHRLSLTIGLRTPISI